MAHLRGISEYAESKGHVALFITQTAPSKMHRIDVHGTRNPSFDGSPVKLIHQHLMHNWQLIRAAVKMKGSCFME